MPLRRLDRPRATRVAAGAVNHDVSSNANPPRGLWRRLAGPLAVAGAAVAGLAWVAVSDPNQPGHFPTCPSLALFGVYCPGCGTLRALHALVHWRPVEAFWLNPALALALPYLAWSWLAWVLRVLEVRPRRLLAPPWVLWTLLAALLAYWVLRNVPALAPWLAPRGVPAPAFA